MFGAAIVIPSALDNSGLHGRLMVGSVIPCSMSSTSPSSYKCGAWWRQCIMHGAFSRDLRYSLSWSSCFNLNGGPLIVTASLLTPLINTWLNNGTCYYKDKLVV